MGWNAIFVLGFIALLILVIFKMKNKGVDKKIVAKWESAKEDFKEKKEEVKEKIDKII